MKKIVALFLLLVPVTLKAKAVSYYGTYGEFSPYQTEAVTESDVFQVEVESRYRFYQEQVQKGNYMKVEEALQKGLFLDQEDKKMTEVSDWTVEKPLLTLGRQVEKREQYQCRNMQKIRYIHLYGTDKDFPLSEIEVQYGPQNINYFLFQCENCSTDFSAFVQNGISHEQPVILYKGGHIILDLLDYYNPAMVHLVIYPFGQKQESIHYEVTYSREESLEKGYLHGSYIFEGDYRDEMDIIPLRLTSDNIPLENPEWEEYVACNRPLSYTQFIEVQSKIQYRFQDILYRSYQKVRSYEPGYYKELAGYEKDKHTKVDFYRYRKRDKFVLDEPLIITEPTIDYTSFVLESTVPYQVSTNINQRKNGKYEISFILPNQTIKVPVIVSIAANFESILKEYQNQINVWENKYQILKQSQEKLKETPPKVVKETIIEWKDREKPIYIPTLMGATKQSQEASNPNQVVVQRNAFVPWFCLLGIFIIIGFLWHKYHKKM